MAGAGYKLFNTGDVLTAAQVNTYLMEQTVMVFADAAARTAALSGVVSEGMISYLKDTNAVEVYNGSAWVASDDPNAIQNTIVDAKGDLITATAADTPARLAVGNNGETLVADSSASTGLRWQSNFAAGKNKIINGDFGIWQRGSSLSLTSSGYTADRFQAVFDGSGSTRTYSRQTFTPGSAPVAGYEGQYFFRLNQSVAGTSGTFNVIAQLIEDVRTLAGQTITFSFWAKADATRNIVANVIQNFGSGGSSEVFVGSPINVNLTTSWVRYSGTVTVPSISGKTVGTNSFLKVEIAMPTNTVMTIDTWGWQVEAGNVATAFQTATGTLAGELAACQRYFSKSYNLDVAPATVTNVGVLSYKTGYTNSYHTWWCALPVQMRTNPTMTFYSPYNGATGNASSGTTNYAVTAAGYIGASSFSPFINNASIPADNLLLVHWTASAEL